MRQTYFKCKPSHGSWRAQKKGQCIDTLGKPIDIKKFYSYKPFKDKNQAWKVKKKNWDNIFTKEENMKNKQKPHGEWVPIPYEPNDSGCKEVQRNFDCHFLSCQVH